MNFYILLQYKNVRFMSYVDFAFMNKDPFTSGREMELCYSVLRNRTKLIFKIKITGVRFLQFFVIKSIALAFSCVRALFSYI